MRHYTSDKQTSFSNTLRTNVETHSNCVQRLKSVNQIITWSCRNGKADAISFKCDTPIHIHGITVYGTANGSSNKLEVEICGQDDKAIYKETKDAFPSSGKQDPTHFLFGEKVIISPNSKYTIIQRTWGSNVYYGREGQQHVVSRGVRFEFSKSSLSRNGTSITEGQISGLLFKGVGETV